jgi:hypothetical protein
MKYGLIKGMQAGWNSQLYLMPEADDEAFETNEVEWAHRVRETCREYKRKSIWGTACSVP